MFATQCDTEREFCCTVRSVIYVANNLGDCATQLMSAILHKNHAHLHFLAMCVTYCIWTAVAYAIAVAQAHDLDYPGAAPSHIAGRCTLT